MKKILTKIIRKISPIDSETAEQIRKTNTAREDVVEMISKMDFNSESEKWQFINEIIDEGYNEKPFGGAH